MLLTLILGSKIFLLEKLTSYLTGIDLRQTAVQTIVYTSYLYRANSLNESILKNTTGSPTESILS